MDLLDFEPTSMYFDEALDPRAEHLILAASLAYGEPEAEANLREAERIQPGHLGVLVALYRYCFYRHDHGAALDIAVRALDIVAARLSFPASWRDVGTQDVSAAVKTKPELARFYLQALKGAGYLHLRLGNTREGLARLDHVSSLDEKDRIGARALADVARQALALEAA